MSSSLFGWPIHTALCSIGAKRLVNYYFVKKIPPWLLKRLYILLDLTKQKKKWITFQEHSQISKNNFSDNVRIYTNYSKKEKQRRSKTTTGWGINIQEAEVTAIDLTLDIRINPPSPHTHTKYISPFQTQNSHLIALKNRHLINPLINKLINRINALLKNKTIILCWIPNYINIQREWKNETELKKSWQINQLGTKFHHTETNHQ